MTFAKTLKGGADDTPRDRERLALVELAHSVDYVTGRAVEWKAVEIQRRRRGEVA